MVLVSRVTLVKDLDANALTNLMHHYPLVLHWVAADAAIPGSYWGEPEAGLISHHLYLRKDTPVHSVLHETCHYLCMDPARRAQLSSDAGGDYDEENAVCYLQILLAGYVDSYSRQHIWRDMDAWGYSFRLGSTRAWFEQDAEDARQWLLSAGLVDSENQPTWALRE